MNISSCSAFLTVLSSMNSERVLVPIFCTNNFFFFFNYTQFLVFFDKGSNSRSSSLFKRNEKKQKKNLKIKITLKMKIFLKIFVLILVFMFVFFIDGHLTQYFSLRQCGKSCSHTVDVEKIISLIYFHGCYHRYREHQ